MSTIRSDVIQFIGNHDLNYESERKLWIILEEFEAKKQRNVLLTNRDVISNQYNNYDELTVLAHLRELQKKDMTMSDLVDTGVAMYVDRLIGHEFKEIGETAKDLSRKWKSIVCDWAESTFPKLDSHISTTSKRPLEQSSVERLPPTKKLNISIRESPICEEDSPRSLDEESEAVTPLW